jgi:predicted nucleic acid-binding protein
MRLVDTSVWIDFFRGAPQATSLGASLESNDGLIHPWIIGELALGSLGRRRSKMLVDLQLLPQAPVVADGDVLRMIEERNLEGKGIGWVDAQLLASAQQANVRLWTHDVRLARLVR